MKKKLNIIKRNSGFVIGCVLVAGASFFATDLVLFDVFTDVLNEREVSAEADTEEMTEKTVALIPEETMDERTFETDYFTVNASGIVLKGAESEEETETEGETEEETGEESETAAETLVETETVEETEAEEEALPAGETETAAETMAGEEAEGETLNREANQTETAAEAAAEPEWNSNYSADYTPEPENNITIWGN